MTAKHEPVLTQTMTMHLNGGSKFSELRYKILADGANTGITRYTRTNGSPKYLKTVDALVNGNESFDILATKGVGMKEWLLAQIEKNKAEGEQP